MPRVRQDLRGLLRKDALARRRFLVFAESLDLILVERKPYLAYGDLRDLLARQVPPLLQQTDPDCEAVEDVERRIADDLLDLADLVTVPVNDLPAGLDHKPGDGIAHLRRPKRSWNAPRTRPPRPLSAPGSQRTERGSA